MKKIVMLGPPGSGKGTQAELISARYGIPSFSVGALLREEIEKGSELGNSAKQYIEAGNLVPDGVIIDVVKECIKKFENGYILDGFPRTLEQAMALEEIDIALCIDIADDAIVERITSRLECADCHAAYNLKSKPPKAAGICDTCGGELKTRTDDDPVSLRRRLEVFREQSLPVREYYDRKGKLIAVGGREKLEDTTKAVFDALEKKP